VGVLSESHNQPHRYAHQWGKQDRGWRRTHGVKAICYKLVRGMLLWSTRTLTTAGCSPTTARRALPDALPVINTARVCFWGIWGLKAQAGGVLRSLGRTPTGNECVCLASAVPPCQTIKGDQCHRACLDSVSRPPFHLGRSCALSL
jgi:hypothetical protein